MLQSVAEIFEGRSRGRLDALVFGAKASLDPGRQITFRDVAQDFSKLIDELLSFSVFSLRPAGVPPHRSSTSLLSRRWWDVPDISNHDVEGRAELTEFIGRSVFDNNIQVAFRDLFGGIGHLFHRKEFYHASKNLPPSDSSPTQEGNESPAPGFVVESLEGTRLRIVGRFRQQVAEGDHTDFDPVEGVGKDIKSRTSFFGIIHNHRRCSLRIRNVLLQCGQQFGKSALNVCLDWKLLDIVERTPKNGRVLLNVRLNPQPAAGFGACHERGQHIGGNASCIMSASR